MRQNKKVTDPNLLDQLEGRKVKNPALLDQLNNNEEDDQGEYLDNLPKEPGFFHKLPRNIAVGLTHAGRNLHNLPHDVAKLAEWPVEKLAGPLKNPLSSYLPNDEEDYSDVFGGNKDSKSLADKLIQGGIEHAPELIGAGGLLRGGLRRLKGTHQLDEVARLANQSGHNNFSLSPHTIEEARNYMPNSHAVEEAVAGSEAGHYPSSFAIQSQVGHHQRNLANSPLAAERLISPRVGDLKQTMLGELGQVLRSNGMHEEADMLRQGINNYRQYVRVSSAAVKIAIE